MQSTIAVASGRLEKIFGRGRRDSSGNDSTTARLERQLGSRTRVGFGLPSFLLVDATGTVVLRSAGVPLDKNASWGVEAALEKIAAAALISVSVGESKPRH